jgi:hypothetical protein
VSEIHTQFEGAFPSDFCLKKNLFYDHPIINLKWGRQGATAPPKKKGAGSRGTAPVPPTSSWSPGHKKLSRESAVLGPCPLGRPTIPFSAVFPINTHMGGPNTLLTPLLVPFQSLVPLQSVQRPTRTANCSKNAQQHRKPKEQRPARYRSKPRPAPPPGSRPRALPRRLYLQATSPGATISFRSVAARHGPDEGGSRPLTSVCRHTWCPAGLKRSSHKCNQATLRTARGRGGQGGRRGREGLADW